MGLAVVVAAAAAAAAAARGCCPGWWLLVGGGGGGVVVCGGGVVRVPVSQSVNQSVTAPPAQPGTDCPASALSVSAVQCWTAVLLAVGRGRRAAKSEWEPGMSGNRSGGSGKQREGWSRRMGSSFSTRFRPPRQLRQLTSSRPGFSLPAREQINCGMLQIVSIFFVSLLVPEKNRRRTADADGRGRAVGRQGLTQQPARGADEMSSVTIYWRGFVF